MAQLPIARPEEIGLDPHRLQQAYDLLEKWTTPPQRLMPGAALLVGRDGATAAPRFFGRQGPEPDAPPLREDAIFLLASITKPFTYLAALKLVERGLLNLAEPVAHWIPEFAAHHKEEIRVLHLFTHTSGLPDMLENNVALRQQHAPLKTFAHHVIHDTVPLFRPGTDVRYQSMGTLMTAELVERISGQTIHDFLQREVLEPLGMTSSGLGSARLPQERLVRVEGRFQETNYSWNSDYWRRLGAPWGGMFSTPGDLAIACQMLLDGGAHRGGRLLAPGTIEMATTNRLLTLPELPEPLARTRPWGLGWQLNPLGASNNFGDLLGPHVFGHTGSTGTLLWIDPRRRAFCVLLTSGEYEKSPWRMRAISNVVSSAVL